MVELNKEIEIITNWKEYTSNLINNTIMNALSYYDSQSNRTLSIVSSFFLPLGVGVGWYGMNFKYMPELRKKYSYI